MAIEEEEMEDFATQHPAKGPDKSMPRQMLDAMKIQNSPHADNFPYSHDIRSRLRGDLIYD
jgi:hypothetical protein